MKKPVRLNLKDFAKELNTKPRRSDSGLSSFVQFKLPGIKGILNEDGSGGYYLKDVKDCFSNSESLAKEIAALEDLARAYQALLPAIRAIKKALRLATPLIPTERVNENRSGKTKSLSKARSQGEGKKDKEKDAGKSSRKKQGSASVSKSKAPGSILREDGRKVRKAGKKA